MNILKKSCFFAVSLIALLTYGHALAAATPENAPVPIQVEVAHAGVPLLEMKSTIQHSVLLKLSQPGSQHIESESRKQHIDTYSDVKLRLDVVDTTRSTVSLDISFVDSTTVKGAAVNDVTKGQYEAGGVHVLERGKTYEHAYNLCLDASKSWCKGTLSITVD
jgi:hypothetical protein